MEEKINFSDRILTKEEIRIIKKALVEKTNSKVYFNNNYHYFKIWLNADKGNSGDIIHLKYFQNKIKITGMFFGWAHKMEKIMELKKQTSDFLKPIIFDINETMGFL